MSQIGCLVMVANYNPRFVSQIGCLLMVANCNPQVYESDRLLADGC